MTDISKEAVDGLLQGVTLGPWTIEYAGGTICLMMGEKCQMCSEAYYPWVPDNEHDWIFIAAARELVPALRAALDETEAREAALLAANETNRETLLRHNADCDRRIRKAEVCSEHWENVAIARDAKLRKAEAERDAANAPDPAAIREAVAADARDWLLSVPDVLPYRQELARAMFKDLTKGAADDRA